MRWPTAAASPPPRIRAIPAEIARVAFEEEITIDQPPGPIFAGSSTTNMVGRPVAMHAMRGISAHSNGFQTARALHMLQILIGSVEKPRRLPLQTALNPPKTPPEAHPRPHAGYTAGPAAGWAALRLSPLGPEHLLLDERRPAQTHRQGIFMGRAAVRPMGLMHMVHQQMPMRAIPTRSTPCFCIWRIWHGIRP